MKPAPPVTKIRSDTVALRLSVSRAAMHEPIEVAFFALSLFFLIKEGELAVVEDVEEIVPRDLLETFFGLAEIYSQNAALRIPLLGCSFDARRLAAAFLYPLLDHGMISRGLRFGHEQSLRIRSLRYAVAFFRNVASGNVLTFKAWKHGLVPRKAQLSRCSLEQTSLAELALCYRVERFKIIGVLR